MAKRRRRILNCLPSTSVEDDWTYDDAVASGALAAAPVPDKKDLRTDWWEIGHQGGSGSCVGWAIADSVIRWHFVRAGTVGEDEMLSVRYLWMAAKETDEFTSRPTAFLERDGTSLKAALDIVRKFGIVLDKQLPFKPARLSMLEAQEFYLHAATRKIAYYLNLGRDLARWREWIANNGPLAVRLDVDDVFYYAPDDGFIAEYEHPGKPSGHAVTLVGYTPDYFIVRNSWGTPWGDKGFAYVSNAYAQAAFTEAYGVGVA